jgi:hypothetical protein
MRNGQLLNCLSNKKNMLLLYCIDVFKQITFEKILKEPLLSRLVSI